MDIHFLTILVPLLAAHVAGDFLTQSDEDIRNKHQPWVLIKHVLNVGVLSYLLLGLPTAWELVLGTTISHGLVDALKVRSKKGSYLSRFFLDQGIHVIVLLLFSWAAAGYRYQAAASVWDTLFGLAYYRALALTAGTVLCVYVGNFVVEHTFQSLQALEEKAEGDDSSQDQDPQAWRHLGLAEGGRVIGFLERSLILVFVLAGQPAGIGFLVAAKSIFRFGELTDSTRRRQAEYIIIGTLMSFLFGTAAAYTTAAALKILR